MFMLAFLAGAADLEDGPRAIGGAHWLHDRAAATDGIAIDAKLPLLQLSPERGVDQSPRARPAHSAHVMTNTEALG
jgi:hypothetical protein